MPRMPDYSPIDYLVERRFPKALDASFSPFADIEAQKRFSKHQKQREAFLRELKKKSKEEIDALVREERAKEAAAEDLRRKNAEARMWFNLPSSSADYEHWSRAAYWTLEEGVALSFGREPTRVNWEAIKSQRQVSPFAASYEKRLDLAKRAAAMKQLYQTNLPGFFLGWARRNNFELPAQLLEFVEQNGQVVADWPDLLKMANERTQEAFEQGKRHRKEAMELGDKLRNELMAAWHEKTKKLTQRIAEVEIENKELRDAKESAPANVAENVGERERESLLKLIIGMAIKGYGHDPKASRTKTAKEIAGDLQEQGISLDEDTVRKYLQQAVVLLPRSETE